MKNVIFTINVEIEDSKLDNPASFESSGIQKKSDKSLITKTQFQKYHNQLINAQRSYADSIGADYFVCNNDDSYKKFLTMLSDYPQISEYDAINFYKHYLMKKLSEKYDQICYLDLDVVPNTNENIFEAFDLSKSFACAESNDQAEYGKTCSPQDYNMCIRNPASKYWNCHAMLLEAGEKPDTDVFNTGIMVASSDIIQKLDYFGNFTELLNLMTELKSDEFSMYPKNIRRVFGYDNETVFAYKRVINKIDVEYMDSIWHAVVVEKQIPNPNAKMWHIINKRFDEVFK